MQLYQPLNGYCFNSDTLFLYDFISKFNIKGKVLEVGSGCGVLGLLMARDMPVELTQVEKQEIFVNFSKKNAKINGIKSTVIQHDFLEYTDTVKYDCIVSNPPFYHNGVVKSTDNIRHIARYNEHLPIDDFVQKVSKMLTPRGRFVFCYDPQVISELICALASNKFTIEDIRYIHPKADKTASLVMIHARKSSKAKTVTHSPLYAFEGENHSIEAKKIYGITKTHSIKCEIGVENDN